MTLIRQERIVEAGDIESGAVRFKLGDDGSTVVILSDLATESEARKSFAEYADHIARRFQGTDHQWYVTLIICNAPFAYGGIVHDLLLGDVIREDHD